MNHYIFLSNELFLNFFEIFDKIRLKIRIRYRIRNLEGPGPEGKLITSLPPDPEQCFFFFQKVELR